MAKELPNLKWIEELLPKDYLRKQMFGGLAYYVDQKIILAMFESTGDRSYKNKKFEFDLWNGCLFPTEREHHQEIQKEFPDLFPHPILSKWLYLPMDTENFDGKVEDILARIRRRSPLFGVLPKPKKKSKKTSPDERIDTRRPKMFSDEPVAQKISRSLKKSK
jgi:hypothetical protein